jgi:uncharacterized protein YdbL (DUF1318 family)
MTPETIALLIAVSLIAALATAGLGKLLAKAKTEAPQAEEAVALAGYHALLQSQATAAQAVTDANTELSRITAKVAQFKALVAGAPAA